MIELGMTGEPPVYSQLYELFTRFTGLWEQRAITGDTTVQVLDLGVTQPGSPIDTSFGPPPGPR
jgi:hypothetical protein